MGFDDDLPKTMPLTKKLTERRRLTMPWEVYPPKVEQVQPRKEAEREDSTVAKTDTVPKIDTVAKSDTVTISKIDTVKTPRTVSKSAIAKSDIVPKKGFLSIPHSELEWLLSHVEPADFKLYIKLYRLSYGFGKETCSIGLATLCGSCNVSKNTARMALENLETLGLVKRIRTINLGKKGYSEYRIYTVSEIATVAKFDTVAKSGTVSKIDPNKEIDDDDNKKKSSSKEKDKTDDDDATTTHHQKETIAMYQRLTGNRWRKDDEQVYQKIKDVKPELIEQGIQLALDRAKNHPNSLGYFVREILRLANPSKKNRAQQKKELKKLVDRYRNLHAGAGNYGIADLAEDVKRACIKEGVAFDNDLFWEIVQQQ